MTIVKKVMPCGYFKDGMKIAKYRTVGTFSWMGGMGTDNLEEIFRHFVEQGFTLDSISIAPDFEDSEYILRIQATRAATVEEIDDHDEAVRQQNITSTYDEIQDLDRLAERYPDLVKKTPVFNDTDKFTLADSLTVK